MKKPTPKKEVEIASVVESLKFVAFYATNDAVTEFEGFGQLSPVYGISDRYDLFVDPRYDFYEVVAYIRNYG